MSVAGYFPWVGWNATLEAFTGKTYLTAGFAVAVGGAGLVGVGLAVAVGVGSVGVGTSGVTAVGDGTMN
jgi:hypothetical protein